MKHLNNMLRRFWSRWKREYLLELREFHRFSGGTDPPTSLSVGEVLLIQDDHPRGFWKLGQVEDMIVGRDGQVRGAVLRVPSRSGHCTTLRRPLQRLYPLEIGCNPSEKAPDTGNAQFPTSQPPRVAVSPRTLRRATPKDRLRYRPGTDSRLCRWIWIHGTCSYHFSVFSFVCVTVATPSS